MPKWPPQIVAQEGNYQTVELFLKVPQNSSKMAFSHILILPCCHSECSYIKSKYRHDRSCLEMSEADGVDGGAFCKRGFTHHHFAEKPEAPKAERHLDTTGRVSRYLKPTVWTVEHSVSGVLHISSLLRSPKLPKRKGISIANFRVETPLARGSLDAATSTWWDLVDLEIFALLEDFEDQSSRVDLEIFTDVIRASINEDLK
ncbi:hypothetical protein HZH68_012689 [Vespula germanica]|uniref:Uncharacterized protein n=1 Tax=Vespula germanica TaxID=30212 RepID=A0A834JIX2_VESGE|nr:hypothetical protein HZH68_012689 [Vespula germanica]